MYNPVSTYRFQFNNHFTLDDLDGLLPYLQTLGVTTIYGSPIFVATPGSSHGYDAVDPTRINPEIGSEAQLRSISARLRAGGMGWFQDIVPNHMAYHPTNEWLMDMLEKGPMARHAQFFETSLSSSFFRGRIQAPFLPGSLDETLAEGALALAYDQDRFVLNVQGNTLPLKPGSYATVLQAGAGEPSEAVQQLIEQLDQLRHNDEPESYGVAWEEFRQQLAALMKNEATAAYVQSAMAAVNESPEQLGALAEEQHYRFCTESETRRAMNYRRFFTVNGLICLNMQDEAVFQAYHALTKRLVDDGIFQGLRVDHVDGLYDPAQYLSRLRELTGEQTYLIVEKILQADEPLPTNWPIQGASGYEFLAFVNNLLTDARSEPVFRDFYGRLVGSQTPIHDQIEDRKRFFLAQYMGGELENLHEYILSLNLLEEASLSGMTAMHLKQAIGEVLVRCPVYRYYGNRLPLPTDEADALLSILTNIRNALPELAEATAVLEEVLLTRPQAEEDAYRDRALRFYQRLMQFSSPLMAKGVEDTLLYTYNAFIGHNEVGDAPERFGMAPDAFHRAMQDRQEHWPLAINATTTHDTKRGEDVRARLNVLTTLPDEWLAEVRQWQQLNADLNEDGVLDANDEYFMYQNLIGAYPMPGVDSPGDPSLGEHDDDFPNRFTQYMEKSLQEAKRHTVGWSVEEDYHKRVRQFIDRLFDRKSAFWARFEPFHRQIADFGILNSFVQTVLKGTCPGVPDIYQGAEGWDLSMVDPDNRRSVDFTRRQRALDELMARSPVGDDTLWADLWQNRFDGRIKLFLTYKLLNARRANPDLFVKGTYVPLAVEGAYQENVLAFARQNGTDVCVVVVPLHTARLCREQTTDVRGLNWHDTRVTLPPNASVSLRSELTGKPVDGTNGLPVQALFETLPVAVLK